MLNLTPLKIDFILGVIFVSLVLIALYVHRQATPPQPLPVEGLGIKDLVDRVKADIMQAEKDGSQKMFTVKKFVLEINFVVKARQSENGAIKYEVITLGAENETSTEKVQKITLHMDAEQQVSDNKPEDKPISDPGARSGK